MQIADPSTPRGSAWLRLGFRPFFLAAGGYAIISMLIWYVAYTHGLSFPIAGLAPVTWHGHEMIYGYSLAVVAGFLLTAVRNWTGIPTLSGMPLFLLFLFWLLARLFILLGGPGFLVATASFDLLFLAALSAAIAVPIIRARQWHNIAIVGKIVLLLASNLVFFLGVAGKLEQGVYWGLYSGLYIIIALIFTLSRRVLPSFIEKGVGYPVELRNSKRVDIASLALFVGFWIADMVRPNSVGVAVFAASLFFLHLWRLLGWYTAGIWKKPLLWVLYLAYAATIAGFALKAAAYFNGISPYLGLHAFAVGGVGLMTLGMMTRVALGHTGRNVFEPPRLLFWVFILLFAALITRVALPMLFQQHYGAWVALSQWLWLSAFLIYLIGYFPILSQPRVDGQDG
ncbi:MAG: NnrS family protein [Thiogranum sp.]